MLPAHFDKPVTAAAVRDSASVIVLRDGAQGLEVLLLRRADRRDQNGGAWVFPGGLVDADDALALPPCAGDDADTLERACRAAALRECLEEAGLLFAERPAGLAAARLEGWRGALQRGEATLAALCAAEGLRLHADALQPHARWITPPGMPKRYDTRFYLALAPAGQQAVHDGDELVELRWLRPADALHAEPPLKMLTPTRHELRFLAGCASAAEAMAVSRARPRPTTMPRLGTDRHGVRPVVPGEPAYAEIARLDPEGRGHVRCVLEPGVPVALSANVIRVTAANGSVMTGPGTNTYLVGGGPGQPWAVIDPGPADEAHVEAILAAAPGPIRWIFATHTHKDHSPACVPLKARTGATVLGRRPAHPDWQDTSFAPDRELAGGERFVLGEGVTLRAVHTPGHASNHLCFRLDEEGLLFTGDHVMQLSTVVINPPDGDMAAYLRSLRELAGDAGLRWLAPGHGFLIERPREAFEKIVAHRLKREAKVLAGLRSHGPASVEALVEPVYDDVDVRLHGVAQRSLLAHLLKLREDGLAACDDGDRWRALG